MIKELIQGYLVIKELFILKRAIDKGSSTQIAYFSEKESKIGKISKIVTNTPTLIHK